VDRDRRGVAVCRYGPWKDDEEEVVATLVLAILAFLAILGCAFMWKAENRTWAKAAMILLAMGAVGFGAIGVCTFSEYRGLDKQHQAYGLGPMVLMIGLGAVVLAIACGVGAWRNRH
jgi:hypothetical protein